MRFAGQGAGLCWGAGQGAITGVHHLVLQADQGAVPLCRFMAFDRHMNLVLGDAEEFRKLPPKKGMSEEDVRAATAATACGLCTASALPAARVLCACSAQCVLRELSRGEPALGALPLPLHPHRQCADSSPVALPAPPAARAAARAGAGDPAR